jgi:transcription initiation factor TFIID TATA-box-binding protein
MVDYDIENIIASTKMEAELDLEKVAESLGDCEYNPASFPGVIYRFKKPRAVALIFDDGRLMCTSAKSIEDVEFVFNEIMKMLKDKGHI